MTAFALTALLVACGGGGGGESSNAGGGAANGTPNAPGGSGQGASANPVPAGFEPITTLAKQAVANAKYFVQTIKSTVTDEVTIALPTTIAVGGTVVVKGDTDIRWKLAQSAGQTMGTRAVPGGVEPGLAFSPQQSPTENWWFVASSASGQKLAAVANNFTGLQAPGGSANGSVWTSADAGATWTERTAPGNAPWSSIASSADGTRLAAVGLGTQIWTSGDSGATWTARATNRSWDSVTMSADGSRIAAATLESNPGSGDGRIYTLESAPGAAFGTGAWIEQNEVQMWRSIASSADGRMLVAAAHRDGATSQQGGGVFTSDNYGVTWTPRSTLAVSAYRVASSADGKNLAMAERFGKIYTSTNFGVTWSAGASEGGFNSVASSADGSVLLAVQANGNSSIEGPTVQPGRTGKLLVSTNAGATWTQRATRSWWRGAAVSADGNRLVGAVDVGQIFVSTSNRSSYGSTGSITGGQTNELTLRYMGDGLFDVTSASGTGYVTR